MAIPYHTLFPPPSDPPSRRHAPRPRLAWSMLRIASTATRRALAQVGDPRAEALLRDALDRLIDAETLTGTTPPHADGR